MWVKLSLTKFCRGCQREFPRSEFHLVKSGRNAGYHASECRKCAAARGTAWRRANPEKVRQQPCQQPAARAVQAKLARERDIEKVRAWSRKASRRYVAKNREMVREKSRQRMKALYDENPAPILARSNRRRAILKGAAFVEDIDIRVLAERDNWTCGCCKGPVDAAAKTRGNRPSLDHIIPLSKGGEHSYANAQLAHQHCNAAKRDRTMNPITIWEA